MIKWLVFRIFGFCDHTWEWHETEWLNVEGDQQFTQKAICKHCGKQKMVLLPVNE